jgi:catechol 2,3-dioxygenase-like lactoylglutathione lyase family enzyme
MPHLQPERILEEYRSGKIDRRGALGQLAACFGAALAIGGVSAAQGGSFEARGLNHLALRVTDVARSRDFYVRHFGAEILQNNPPHNCFLGFGENFVALFRGKTAGLDHFCFTIDDYDAAEVLQRLEAEGLESHRVEDRVYFKDPDGLEGQIAGRFSSWPGGRER